MKKSEIITAAAITAAITGTIGIVQHVDALSTQYKTTATLCMRKGPGTNYPVIKKLALGQTVTVVSIDRYGWAKLSNGCIRLHNSDIEWLFNLVTAYDCTVVIY